MDCRVYRKGLIVTLRRGLMLALLFVATQSQLTLQAQENWRDSLTAINKQIAESQWSTELHLRKANAKLKWNSNKTSFEELVKLMVESDVAKVAAEGAAAKVRTNLAEYLEKGIVK